MEANPETARPWSRSEACPIFRLAQEVVGEVGPVAAVVPQAEAGVQSGAGSEVAAEPQPGVELRVVRQVVAVGAERAPARERALHQRLLAR